MKKFVSLLILTAMLVSCGSESGVEPTSQESNSETTTEAASTDRSDELLAYAKFNNDPDGDNTLNTLNTLTDFFSYIGDSTGYMLSTNSFAVGCGIEMFDNPQNLSRVGKSNS